MPTSKNLNELPSVEDTVDVVSEDADANVPTVVTTPSRGEIRARADARAVQESGIQLRRRSRNGNGRLSPQVRQLQRIAKDGV